MRGQVDRPGQSVEDARPLADRSRIEAVGGHARFARENDDADLFAAGVELGLRALLQRPRLEADIAPSGAGRGDAMADAVGAFLRMNEQFRLRHCVPLIPLVPLAGDRMRFYLSASGTTQKHRAASAVLRTTCVAPHNVMRYDRV